MAATKEIRVRISTALLLAAAPFYPFSTYWVHLPWFPKEPELLHKSVGWLFFEMPAELIGIALFAAIFAVAATAYRRQWAGFGQSIFEIGICLLAALLLPTY